MNKMISEMMDARGEFVAHRNIVEEYGKDGGISSVTTTERYRSGRSHMCTEDYVSGNVVFETHIDAGDVSLWGTEDDFTRPHSFNDLPSTVVLHSDGSWEARFECHGERHREGDKPASIEQNARGDQTLTYYVANKMKRTDGGRVVEKTAAKPLLGFRLG